MNPANQNNVVKRTKIAPLLRAQTPAGPLLVKGWVRTKRDAKGFSFIELNDGSCLSNIQVLADDSSSQLCDHPQNHHRFGFGSLRTFDRLQRPRTTMGNTGVLGDPDRFGTRLLSSAKETPHDEYLRTIAHLRPRTNKYGAALRIRSQLAYAVHRFFQERGFQYIHTPILTASDCEGAGEMFRVTSLPPGIDRVEDDFFGVVANLTVSGQLEAEMLALALGDVYTFGPTFRAENSNTRRHAAEFWMIEPEMAFCDLAGKHGLGGIHD
jgi:asparaginyl-tRNA synthetase